MLWGYYWHWGDVHVPDMLVLCLFAGMVNKIGLVLGVGLKEGDCLSDASGCCRFWFKNCMQHCLIRIVV